MSDLKPCPRCESEPVLRRAKYSPWQKYWCPMCGFRKFARGQWSTGDAAITWNKSEYKGPTTVDQLRAQLAAETKRADEAEKKLKDLLGATE